ncbi:MAG: ABC transporter substrate-binding protein [Caldilineaceae bacterium]|nr:ABC transporter substrate-binding protein [Caldilineaceae bacterium]
MSKPALNILFGVPARRLLRGAFLSALAVVLVACSVAAPAEDAGVAAETGAETADGGWLRVAAAGWANDQFNPFFAQSLADYIGLWNVYDAVAWLEGAEVRLGLAESVTPNEDGTVWTIELKEAWFHDGSPVRAQDVAYSLSTYANPELAPFFAPFFFNLDVANLDVPDDKTLVVPLHSPQGDFLERTLATISLVVPEGTVGGQDAIGSGPFKLEAYEAGKSIRLVRNADYWTGAPPALDGLEVIIIDDANARLNALKGGEVEFATQITPAGALGEAGNADIVLQPAGVANSTVHSFAANTTMPPFDNPDVVRGLKLAIDRQALVDTVLLGYGEVGNDLIGKGLPGYHQELPQVERDVEEARRLFASAGVVELTMLTGEVTPGATAAAELLVQYLAEAGVALTLEEIPADQYYADFMRLLSTPLQTAYWTNRPAASHTAMMTGSNGGFNLTGMAGEEYDAMLMALVAEVDAARRVELGLEVQEYLYANDGQIVWAFQPDLNASVPGISGVLYSQSAPRFHLTTWER